MVMKADLIQGSEYDRVNGRTVRMVEVGGPYGYCPLVLVGAEKDKRTGPGYRDGGGREGTVGRPRPGNRDGYRSEKSSYSGTSRGRHKLSRVTNRIRRTPSRHGTGQRAKLRLITGPCPVIPKSVGESGDNFMKTVGEWIMSFLRRPDPVERYNPDEDSFVQDLQNEVKLTKKIHDRRESPEAWRARNSFEREFLRGPKHVQSLDRN